MGTSFQERLPQTKNMFIPFIVAGDPTPEATIELALQLQAAGASIIELGIPYSDPLADGPVIQRASARALRNKMSLQKAMELVPIMRKKGLKIPVIVFTYFNPMLQLGEESFFALAQKNEIDGLLVPDLPFEESGHLRQKCTENGLEFISLVAPTSQKRIEKIAKEAQGFLYCVSSLGVTGVRNELHDTIYEFLKEVRQHSEVPIAVGFGISKYEQIELLQDHCDGIVIGSAIVKKIEELSDKLADEETRIQGLAEFKEYVTSIVSP